MVNKIYYVADFNLPNMSAYALHVLKMCDALCEPNNEVTLIIPFIQKKYKFDKIKKEFLLKKNFKIKILNRKKEKSNLVERLLFGYKVYRYLSKIKSQKFIISRSIISSLTLSIFGEKNLLEIHAELSGVTYFLVNIMKVHLIKGNIRFIFLNEYLRRIFSVNKKNSIILDDAVDIRDFKKKKYNRKNSCVYTGSFVEGKGIEIITQIAKRLKKTDFFLYGNINTLPKKYSYLKKENNIHFKGFAKYNNIPNILTNHKVLLMPYGKKVGILAKDIDVSNYFSPLKMFDYLAAGGVIVASNLKVYKKILTKKNSLKINDENVDEWVKKINLILMTNKFNYLRNKAVETAKKYTWQKRVLKIFKFINRERLN